MRTRVILIIALAAIALFGVVFAGGHGNVKWQGSIPVTDQHTQAELADMAKITLADAQKIALKDGAKKNADIEIIESELEVEHGFLVYCIEIATAGQKGVDEIVIDAGTGQVLAVEHEDEDDDHHGGHGGEDHTGHGGEDHTGHGDGDGTGDDHGHDDHAGEPK